MAFASRDLQSARAAAARGATASPWC